MLKEPVLLGRLEGARDDSLGLVLVRQAMLRVLFARLGLGLVLCPLPQREHGLLRLVDDLLAELDGLGQHDLFLGIQERHLADLLEVHADRVVDADHVGGDRVQLLGGRLLGHLRVQLGRRLFPRCLLGLVDGHVDAELGYGGHAVCRLVQLVRSASIAVHPVFVAASLATLQNAGYQLLIAHIHVLPP